jgi:hypothetical protein
MPAHTAAHGEQSALCLCRRSKATAAVVERRGCADKLLQGARATCSNLLAQTCSNMFAAGAPAALLADGLEGRREVLVRVRRKLALVDLLPQCVLEAREDLCHTFSAPTVSKSPSPYQ